MEAIFTISGCQLVVNSAFGRDLTFKTAKADRSNANLVLNHNPNV
jgi:hypothetical protein